MTELIRFRAYTPWYVKLLTLFQPRKFQVFDNGVRIGYKCFRGKSYLLAVTCGD